MPQDPPFALTDADRHAVRDRLDQADDQCATVETFLADIAAWLDAGLDASLEAGLDAERTDAARRQSVLAYAA
jgi:hypothetical protein